MEMQYNMNSLDRIFNFCQNKYWSTNQPRCQADRDCVLHSLCLSDESSGGYIDVTENVFYILSISLMRAQEDILM